MQLLALIALDSLLGFSIAWAFDLGFFLKFGLPLLFLLGNLVLAPLLMDRAFRIEWNPGEPPLDEEVCHFLLDIFQAHGKAVPADLAELLGSRASLPVALGVVQEEAPHLMLAKAPNGGAGLVVSTGFRQLLTHEEQKAALAHEVYYLLRQERTFLSNALMLLPTLLFTAYRFVEPDPGGNWFQRYAAQLLYALYRLSVAASAWSLRDRVYKADDFAVEMTGNPNALASAILVLSYGLAHRDPGESGGGRGVSAPYDLADADQGRRMAVEAEGVGDFTPEGLVRALRWEQRNLAARFFELFSHHPLPSRRLRSLEKHASDRGHEFTFPLEQGGGAPRVVGLLAELISRAAPWAGAYLGYHYCLAYDWPSNVPFFVVLGFTLGIVLASVMWYRPFSRYRPCTTRDLMTDLDVSDSHPISARLEGRIAGRHKPGYAFGADLVFEDEKGTLQLVYKQPVPILDSVFAYYAADELRGRPARVEGWFRRNPEPFLEIRRLTMLDDGRVFGCYRFLWQWMLVGLFAWLTAWVYRSF